MSDKKGAPASPRLGSRARLALEKQARFGRTQTHDYRGTSLVKTPPSQDPTVGLYLGSYGGPRRGAVSYERGTPVARERQARFGTAQTHDYSEKKMLSPSHPLVDLRGNPAR